VRLLTSVHKVLQAFDIAVVHKAVAVVLVLGNTGFMLGDLSNLCKVHFSIWNGNDVRQTHTKTSLIQNRTPTSFELKTYKNGSKRF
jgi:hypothetical protein